MSAPIVVSLEITVEADPGSRLAGVPIRIDGEPSGQTNEKGILLVEVRGSSGRTIRIAPDCPSEHRAEPVAARFRLRGYQTNDVARMGIKLTCRPTVRVAVFVVRAKNGPNIPIEVDGEVVATTSDLGVAHFAKSAPAGTEFLIELDTSAQSSLLPRRVKMLAKLADSSEVFVIDQSFELTRSTTRRRQRRRPIIKIE